MEQPKKKTNQTADRLSPRLHFQQRSSNDITARKGEHGNFDPAPPSIRPFRMSARKELPECFRMFWLHSRRIVSPPHTFFFLFLFFVSLSLFLFGFFFLFQYQCDFYFVLISSIIDQYNELIYIYELGLIERKREREREMPTKKSDIHRTQLADRIEIMKLSA